MPLLVSLLDKFQKYTKCVQTLILLCTLPSGMATYSCLYCVLYVTGNLLTPALNITYNIRCYKIN